jgi:hypothetical protein
MDKNMMDNKTFQLVFTDLMPISFQDKVRRIIESNNLIDALPPSNEVEVHIEGQVPPGSSLIQAHSNWQDGNFSKVETPAKFPRQPDGMVCPPGLLRLGVECIEKRNPGMSSYYGFTGYYLSVLISLDHETIWDARGERTK